jgi:hypothetical protein
VVFHENPRAFAKIIGISPVASTNPRSIAFAGPKGPSSRVKVRRLELGAKQKIITTAPRSLLETGETGHIQKSSPMERIAAFCR